MTVDNQSPVCDPVLANSPFFTGMSDAEINTIAVFLESRHIKKGDCVFREEDQGDHMFILLSGKLTAHVLQPDGTQRQMFDVKLGDFFGEMSIIANEPRSATITAMEDTEIVAIPGSDFYGIVFEHPMIGVKMLKSICRVQNIWLDQTSRHLSDLTRWGETARRRAITDEMTGLYSRNFLDDSIKDRFEQGSVGIRTMSFLMLDLDRIHAINDRHGTSAGDKVFMVVADILRSCTRAGDICARFAGDEFGVLLPDTGPEEALSIAERIRGTIAATKILVPRSPDVMDKVEIYTRTSIGAAVAPKHGKDRETLMLAADNALRKAKEKGRDRVELAD
jgi:diguanylate cyclase (GGDEF)-like protein